MEYHDNNLLYFKKVLQELNESQKNIDIWVAFGDAVLKRKYLINCLMDFYNSTSKYNLKWYCTSKNKSGTPRHPLYEQDRKLSIFDMFEFVKKLSEVNGK